jgi:hypothetical protein
MAGSFKRNRCANETVKFRETLPLTARRAYGENFLLPWIQGVATSKENKAVTQQLNFPTLSRAIQGERSQRSEVVKERTKAKRPTDCPSVVLFD